MRRAVSLFLAVLMVFCISCQNAEETEPEHKRFGFEDIPGITQEEVDAIKALKAKRHSFLYGMNHSTETFRREDGTIGGFTSLYCKLLTEVFGTKFVPEIYEWNDLMANLDSTEIDFTGELAVTPENLEKYSMTDAIVVRTMRVYHKANSEPLAVIAANRTPRYVFMNGSPVHGWIAASSEYPFKAIFVNEYDEAAAFLLRGTADAFFDLNPAEAAFDKYDSIVSEDFLPLVYAPVSFATANPELAPMISALNKYLESGGIYYLNDLYRDGYQEYQKNKIWARLSGAEKEYISLHASTETAIPILAEFDNYPASFYNEQEQEFQGIAIDILDEVSALTGLQFRPVNHKTDYRVDLLRMLGDGDAALITELIDVSARRNAYLFSTQPYAQDYYALLSRAETEDIDLNQVLYAKVGVMEGSDYEDFFREWFPDNKNILRYRSNEAAFQALESGEIDFVMATQKLLLSLTNYLEKPGFKANIVFKRSYGSAFGFGKQEATLRSVIDKCMQMIDISTISDRWTRKTFDYRVKVARAQIPLWGGIALLMTVGLISVLALLMKNAKISRGLEKMVKVRTRELEIQTEAAQVASSAKSDFLARMSHEIRTPLNAIIGMTQIARRSVDRPEKVLDSIDEISTASQHLLGILNDVLDMSKIESGKFEISLEPFPLSEAMEEVAAIVSQRCQEKSIAFTTDIASLGDGWATGDKLRLKQVLINLLGNAVKFTPQDGTIRFSAELVSETGDERVVAFTVADSGIGMSAEQISRLFVAFEQADKSIAARFGGTGLGLAISQNLVNKMGGHIEVDSAPGCGSTFRFTLSLPKAERAAEDAGEQPVQIPALNGKRILLVEDVEINRLIITELLADTSCEIVEAEDGQRAVEVFEASDLNSFDIIFMDIQMPQLNGYEATERIRALPRADAATVPIVAMTANAYREDIERALAVGMNAHLSKPVDMTLLMRLLADLL